VIQLQQHAEGVVLPVRARAGARSNALGGIQDGELKVAVTQAPEKGKANKAIMQLLCEQLSLKRSQLELVAGDTSTRKRFLVRSISAGELADRIMGHVDP
jgi:uncharacterized protein (TIGR00251 family)